MPISILQFLDVLMYTIHVVVISINTFGWIFRRTRKIHLVVVLTTAFSWLVLGLWFGFGYCFLTDWEWDIKRQLGEISLPPSFIHYMINNSLNLSIDAGVLDLLTGLVFAVALVMSVVLNYRDMKIQRS